MVRGPWSQHLGFNIVRHLRHGSFTPQLVLCLGATRSCAGDSSTKERSTRSMWKRYAWIPAYFTSNTCILKLVICTMGTSYLEFWRLGR
ncbi:hypothetical protein FJTKL_03432 [Diaporthe vaccinii]|uniref:Secreted protein n=1 Tax=Diaporthe vaccinii TaxID=105482 RepID=A0ABR4F242_9PEZI